MATWCCHATNICKCLNCFQQQEGMHFGNCRPRMSQLYMLEQRSLQKHGHAGLSRLEKQGGVATAFDAITIGALLRASGCDASFKVHRNEASVIEEWDVVA